eukprot:Nk52_evm60s32 gene=Nk52_evmTU60s32
MLKKILFSGYFPSVGSSSSSSLSSWRQVTVPVLSSRRAFCSSSPATSTANEESSVNNVRADNNDNPSPFKLNPKVKGYPIPEGDSPAEIAADRMEVRSDWSLKEIQEIYESPLLDLVFSAAKVHRKFQPRREVQQCTLLSIKTGGCSEDCSYCPQSSKYDTGVKAERLMSLDAVLAAARRAKDAGSTRFCMGAAWRDMMGRKRGFKKIVDMVKEVRAMDMEVCCTLGMIEKEQAAQLKEAGLTAYNHNVDTSREFYPKIITTRSYDERLETIQHVRDAGLSVCSGGIIGLGETPEDRVGMLFTLSNMKIHPGSVPINALVPCEGTPMADNEKVDILELVRMIATTRIVMPNTVVRLSAGRIDFNMSQQGMCFLAGANSIFTGDKLLTTQNNSFTEDQDMFSLLGLVPKQPNFKVEGQQRDNAEETEKVAANM